MRTFFLLLTMLFTVSWKETLSLDQMFLMEPNNITVLHGDQVMLPCIVENRVGEVQWTKDRFGLGEGRELPAYRRYNIIGSDVRKNWTLQIQPVFVEDDGVFQCQVGAADDVRPIRSRNAKLTVYLPPEDPIILQGSKLEVKEGETAQLTCVSPRGRPAADVLWYNGDGKPVTEGVNLEFRRLEDQLRYNSTSNLTFKPRRENHLHNFTCSASSLADREVRTASITLIVRYRPTVQLLTNRDPVYEGETLTFTCQANSYPAPETYVWYLNSHLVPGHTSSSYTIANISRTYHETLVSCEVENDLGVTSKTMMINVFYRPQVRVHPGDRAGEDGEMVVLYCRIESNPPPIYTWISGSSGQVVGSSQNLTVRVSSRTEGEYFCNGISQGYEPVSSHPGRIRLKGPPTISKHKAESALRGGTGRLTCTGTSVPSVTKVIWRLDQGEIDTETEKYEVMVSLETNFGFSSTLLVRKIGSSDYGEYSCTAVNGYGEDEKVMELLQKESAPVLMIITLVMTSVTFLLVVVTVIIYFRKKIIASKIEEDDRSNYVDSSGFELDEDDWTSSYDDNLHDKQLEQYRGRYTDQINQLRRSSEEFWPQPDLVTTSYMAGHPEDFSGYESDTSLQSAGQLHQRYTSELLITDPRYSAAYGNPYLCSPTTAVMPPYSSFNPAESSSPVLGSKVSSRPLHPSLPSTPSLHARTKAPFKHLNLWGSNAAAAPLKSDKNPPKPGGKEIHKENRFVFVNPQPEESRRAALGSSPLLSQVDQSKLRSTPLLSQVDQSKVRSAALGSSPLLSHVDQSKVRSTRSKLNVKEEY